MTYGNKVLKINNSNLFHNGQETQLKKQKKSKSTLQNYELNGSPLLQKNHEKWDLQQRKLTKLKIASKVQLPDINPNLNVAIVTYSNAENMKDIFNIIE